VLDAALRSLDDEHANVAEAAIGAARMFVSGSRGITVIDRVTSIAVDRTRPDSVRIAAVQALTGLRPATLKPLLRTLNDDPSHAIRALVESRHGQSFDSADANEIVRQATTGSLPDEPEALRQALNHPTANHTLQEVKRLVEAVRERERGAPTAQRAEWMMVRAAAHVLLARRGSRIALYDLRETLETTVTPLPVEFVTALVEGGDASCLESIAAAYVRVPTAAHASADWWHRQLVDAFGAIVAREVLTKRHASVRRLDKRWPGILRDLWPDRSRQ
jgi:hypothetical protein